ncbi:MAG: translesion error-prone DNA polymerase V autoproteolytic subunit [Bacteroidales bacterium]|jgi:DNA polymerase V|nr:translesion error-prone DNA polymerase V autoproteolytic subunit [Bacteroidales bacterium]MBR0313524.1 translesion error-prone DNA polymerase V autoproteolytic subunit [Bacteroidales bacterium]
MTGSNVSLVLPVADGGIRAGFPSPAQDYLESGIDLNKELVKNPSSTFFGRVSGDSMAGAGIEDGDLIVIDKSISASEGDIAVCFVDGEFTLKRIHIENDFVWLVPENPKYRRIKVTPDQNFMVWGVVTYSIKDVRGK